MMRKVLAAVLAALLMSTLPAWADDNAEVLIVNGRDRLTLSPTAAVSYQEYFQQECPLVLAAHESGRWVTETTGPDENCFTGSVDYRRFIHSTLANCEGGWRYGECWIVALGREIVWEGPIKFRKGKWTPRTDRQFSVTLAAEAPNTTSGKSFKKTVGLVTYSADGKTAAMRFAPQTVLGRCSGELHRVEGQPWPFAVTCSKIGKVAGLFDVGPDGRTGQGAGGGTDVRHFKLVILPRMDLSSKQRIARKAANPPQS